MHCDSKSIRLARVGLLALMILSLGVSGRADDEILFRDLRLRLIGVEANQPDNPRDDAVIVIVRTATTSRRLTIPENSSQFLDDYEIFVSYVEPDATKPGAGTAQITVYGSRAPGYF